MVWKQGVESSFAGYKCKTVMRDNVLALPTGQGREILGIDCADGFTVEARYFTSGLWFYQLAAIYHKDRGDTAAARRFLESFKLTASEQK